jgi:DNA-binding response OmpR family regulator
VTTTPGVLPTTERAILVVDDDYDIRNLVAATLVDAGYAVVVAAHGLAALEVVDICALQVILLDMKMPIMDGWTFVKHYHARSEAAAPIIVMTAAYDAAARAREIGAAGCLAKPFDLDDLLAMVRTTLSLST